MYLPSTTANLNSNATDDTICSGSAVVITADDVPGATYTFRLNGLAVPAAQVAGRVYTTSTITQESVVTVEVTNGTGCSATGSLTIYVPKVGTAGVIAAMPSILIRVLETI